MGVAHYYLRALLTLLVAKQELLQFDIISLLHPHIIDAYLMQFNVIALLL